MSRAQLQVRLLQHTPEPERMVAAAARLCYAAAEIDELWQLPVEQQQRLLHKILQMGHDSVLEHALFNFGIAGISRACSHQLVRHRLASYSQQSQRYVVQQDDWPWVEPASWEQVPELAQEARQLQGQAQDLYQRMHAAGVPAEDARLLLPQACATQLVVSMNARQLRHFFALRCCRRAQWEIRALAKEMLRRVLAVAPALFAGAGPPCCRGPCPEGAFSCGQQAAVRDEYAQLGTQEGDAKHHDSQTGRGGRALPGD